MAAGSQLGHGNLKPTGGYIGDPARAQNPVSLQVSPRQNDDEADQRLVEQQKARLAACWPSWRLRTVKPEVRRRVVRRL